MIRRWLALLLSLLLLSGMARAEIQWKTDTPAQQQIQSYIEQVNTILTTAGELPVNRLFEMYQSFAVLGMTLTDDAETPEGVEITVKLFYDTTFAAWGINAVSTFGATFVGCAVYIAAMLVIGGIGEEDMERVPMVGHTFIRFLRKIGVFKVPEAEQ